MTDRTAELLELAARRILILDGAMGTMIQRHELAEADYRGERFKDWPSDVRGNNDLLSLTRPDVIREIHDQYLAAGADIVETNTFNANGISMADYGMEALVFELNHEGARLARAAADGCSTADKPRFVAGVLGPTSRTLSLSPDVNDPGFRNVSWDALVATYYEATDGLVKGGADLILIETVFDTLNAKAAVFAVKKYFDEAGLTRPIMISGTITDASGRTLSGQTAEAFWNSLRHAEPFSFGFNCALGAKELRQHVDDMAGKADCLVSAHPNAGLPNAFGGYDESAAQMAAEIGEWARSGLLNIVGGLLHPTSGEVRVGDVVVRGPLPHDVAFVFQEPTLGDRLTAEQNRRFPAGLYHVPPDQIEQRIERALRLAADEEALPFAPGCFDLVLSCLSLHWVNDLPGTLVQIRRSLKPDGLLLAALLGGETLYELRAAWMEAELAEEAGAGVHVSPFADVRDAGALLQRAGFALPVTDTERIAVQYADAASLMHDLRGMGETNAALARRPGFTRRATLARMAAVYDSLFARQGRIPATFEVVYLTAWAPHESQPKALRPGSAAARLADALGSEERPAGDTARPGR